MNAQIIGDLIETKCECCGEYADCVECNGLFICEPCVNHFSTAFFAHSMEKENKETK